MVEGSSQMWELICMVITRIWWRVPLTCGQLTCTVITRIWWLTIKSTWKSLHVSHNIVCSQSCHEHIHIMGWRDTLNAAHYTMHGSHTLIKICSYLTVSQRESSKSTWKSLHVSHNIVCSQIGHKHIHIMGWKDQTSKEIATCGKFASLSSCCEKAAAGMLRPFYVHFIPLQSKSTQPNMHDSHADTENCIK